MAGTNFILCKQDITYLQIMSELEKVFKICTLPQIKVLCFLNSAKNFRGYKTAWMFFPPICPCGILSRTESSHRIAWTVQSHSLLSITKSYSRVWFALLLQHCSHPQLLIFYHITVPRQNIFLSAK